MQEPGFARFQRNNSGELALASKLAAQIERELNDEEGIRACARGFIDHFDLPVDDNIEAMRVHLADFFRHQTSVSPEEIGMYNISAPDRILIKDWEHADRYATMAGTLQVKMGFSLGQWNALYPFLRDRMRDPKNRQVRESLDLLHRHRLDQMWPHLASALGVCASNKYPTLLGIPNGPRQYVAAVTKQLRPDWIMPIRQYLNETRELPLTLSGQNIDELMQRAQQGDF